MSFSHNFIDLLINLQLADLGIILFIYVFILFFRKVYWTEQGETSMIFEASMDGSSKRPLVNESQVGTPNHLYLDYTTDR
jgi:hypothetical protein